MKSSNSSCPELKELRGYVLGTLDDRALGQLDLHLASCPTCERTIGSLDAERDTLMERLRKPLAVDAFAAEDALAAALDQFKAQAGTDADASASDTCEGPTGHAAHSPPPKSIREYEIIKTIGSGGMGDVYLARHTRLQRQVALKILPVDQLSHPQALVRFHREMAAVGRLEHPNIVRAFDAGEHDGLHYLAMEFVAGADLSQVMRRLGPLTIGAACEAARQVALALACAHEAGLVHRDIKPSNLMLMTQSAAGHSSQGKMHPAPLIKLLDLGLARLSESGDSTAGSPPTGAEITTAGQIMGTMDYMAPEQWGESHSADIRADLYGLGATLYKLLTGQAPFPDSRYRSRTEKMAATLSAPAEPLAKARPDVPPALSSLVARLLAKAPSDRPNTPQEVAEALAPFARPQELLAVVKKLQSPANAAFPPQSLSAAAESPADAGTGDALTVDLAAASAGPPGTPTVDKRAATRLADRPAGRRTRNAWPLVAATFVPVLVVLGVWVVIRDKQGKEVGRFQIPKSGSATIETDAAEPDAAAEATQHAPAPTAWQPSEVQQRWLDSVKGLTPDDLAAAVALRLAGENPGLQGQPQFEISEGKVVGYTAPLGPIDKPPPSSLWPLAALLDLKRLDIEITPAAEFAPLASVPLEEIKGVTITPFHPFAARLAGLCPTLQAINGVPCQKWLGRRQEIEELRRTQISRTPEEQIAKVREKLEEYNPGLDATTEGVFKIENRKVYEFYLSNLVVPELFDISPMHALPDLTSFALVSHRVSDYSPLADAELEYLAVEPTRTTPESWPKLKAPNRLARLSLRSAFDTDRSLDAFAGCENLTELNLCIPQVRAGLSHFRNCKQLTVLGLQVPCSDAELAYFAGCGDLITLLIWSRDVTEAGLAHFRDCKKLRVLDFHGQPITDAGLAHFDGCTELEYLAVSQSQATDVGLASFRNCKKLTTLLLGSTRVTDAGLAIFGQCQELKQLGLYSTSVTDAGLEHVKGWTKLRYLALYNTQVTDTGLAALSEIDGPLELNVSHTQVTLAGAQRMKALHPNWTITWDDGIVSAAE